MVICWPHIEAHNKPTRRHTMKSTIIEQYENEKGELVLNILKTELANGKTTFRYIGKGSFGAGCSNDFDEMKKGIFAGKSAYRMKRTIKREVIIQNVFPC